MEDFEVITAAIDSDELNTDTLKNVLFFSRQISVTYKCETPYKSTLKYINWDDETVQETTTTKSLEILTLYNSLISDNTYPYLEVQIPNLFKYTRSGSKISGNIMQSL